MVHKSTILRISSNAKLQHGLWGGIKKWEVFRNISWQIKHRLKPECGTCCEVNGNFSDCTFTERAVRRRWASSCVTLRYSVFQLDELYTHKQIDLRQHQLSAEIPSRVGGQQGVKYVTSHIPERSAWEETSRKKTGNCTVGKALPLCSQEVYWLIWRSRALRRRWFSSSSLTKQAKKTCLGSSSMDSGYKDTATHGIMKDSEGELVSISSRPNRDSTGEKIKSANIFSNLISKLC